jgi:hypothetical protein
MKTGEIPSTNEQLKLSGITGFGVPGRSQGAALDMRVGPQNRAQRRLWARIKRRAKHK